MRRRALSDFAQKQVLEYCEREPVIGSGMERSVILSSAEFEFCGIGVLEVQR
jgi:hypothetical protein